MDSTKDREYLRSHPWLTFSFDTRTFSHEIWMLLGAAQSKCKHIQGVPLDNDHAKELYTVYLAKGALATTAIEGNTLSEEEVRNIVENKSTVPPSRQYLEQEVKNILNAYERIANSHIDGNSPELTVDEICDYNRLVLRELKLRDDVIPGTIRNGSVVVGRYRGAPAQDCHYLLDRLCSVLNRNFTLGDRWEYATGLLKAIISHIYIAWIHPFGDGNGRTARLVEVKFCAASGIPKPACQILSNFYNKTRTEYYRQLDIASKTKDINGFILYALSGLVDMLDEQIAIIRSYQMQSAWENLVHKVIKGVTPTAQRRRWIALDLYSHEDGFQKTKLKEISTRVAMSYVRATSRMITRDINALKEVGLVLYQDKKVYANRERILAWLPPRRITH